MQTRVIVISGASTGIGLASAIHLKSQGFHVVAGVRKQEDVNRLQSDGIDAHIFDVTAPSEIESLVTHVQENFRDAKEISLINNAGIVRAGPWEMIPDHELQAQFDVNVFGVIRLTRALLPFIRRTRGRIVNVSSIAGVIPTAYLGPYCASKAALESITDTLRQELSPYGVEVVSINPGPIDTPIWKKADANDYLLKELEKEDYGIYQKPVKDFIASTKKAEQSADPVEKVIDALDQALAQAKPKTRYFVGRGIRLAASVATHVPDRMADWLRARVT